MANVDKDKEVTCGRGNISFTTINLPRLGIIAGDDLDLFFKLLDDRIDLVIRQLLHRYKIQGRRRVLNYPFLMGNGIWIDSDKLDWNDPIESVIKHGTLTIGFIGLAECLVALTGKHHGESDSSQELGLRIVKRIRERCDMATENYGLNFSCIATPAEGLCLAGDTLVQTIDGNVPIKNIKAGDLIPTFNFMKNRFELDRVIKAGMTSASRKVVKVTFDTGQSIVCTPNHTFPVRKMFRDKLGRSVSVNGTNEYIEWVEAEKLVAGNRIKSGYREQSPSGYVRYKNHEYIHKMVYEYYSKNSIPDGFIVHHKDGNKRNNSFDNLELMSEKDHKIHHMKDTIGDFCYTRESTLGDLNPFFGKKHSKNTKDKISQAKRSQNRFKGQKNLNFSVVAQEYYDGSSIKKLADKYGYSYFTMRNRLIENGVSFQANHIVTKVEVLNEEIPVYDLTMEHNHNFIVGGECGIIVHNSGRFVPLDRQRYGEIPGVTDRLYYTNSFHVPVYFPIKAFKKIEIEAPYHEYTNGGHITYVELDGNTANNLPAFEKIIRYMHDKGVGYGSINHPVDRDPVCGYVGVIGDVCPRCGRHEGESVPVEKLRELRKQYANVPKY